LQIKLSRRQTFLGLWDRAAFAAADENKAHLRDSNMFRRRAFFILTNQIIWGEVYEKIK